MRKLRMGMIGGGRGAFIGKVHHMAAIMDNKIELVCGAFSSDPKISKESGIDYKIAPDRSYASYKEMITTEATLPEDERIDFVAIVTPNHVHYQPAMLAMENGFHVVCDKPLSYSLEEAIQLSEAVKKHDKLFAVTHAYNGYPMVKEAREILRQKKLGKIRRINVEYTQGWLSKSIEEDGQKQASWRTDPKRAGKSCTMGDIGVHAFNLIEYISELKVSHICADIIAHVPGRLLDDDGSMMLRFKNGAKGTLTASQVCAGEENDLKIKIYGEKGGLEWSQLEPNTLQLKWLDKHKEIIRTGVGDLSEAAMLHTRVPAGHPEGYIEAFANIYRNFALHLEAKLTNSIVDMSFDFPTIEDGVRGMKFIDKVVESSQSEQKWIEL